MGYDLGRRQIAALRVCASPQRLPASAKGSSTVQEGCTTLVLRSVSHGNRDCTTDVQGTSRGPARWRRPDQRVSRFVTGVLP